MQLKKEGKQRGCVSTQKQVEHVCPATQLCSRTPGYPFFLIFVAELELLLWLHAQVPPGMHLEPIIKEEKRFHTVCGVL